MFWAQELTASVAQLFKIFSFHGLYERIDAQIEQQRAQTITLENAFFDIYKRCGVFLCSYTHLTSIVETPNNRCKVVRYMMIS